MVYTLVIIVSMFLLISLSFFSLKLESNKTIENLQINMLKQNLQVEVADLHFNNTTINKYQEYTDYHTKYELKIIKIDDNYYEVFIHDKYNYSELYYKVTLYVNNNWYRTFKIKNEEWIEMEA